MTLNIETEASICSRGKAQGNVWENKSNNLPEGQNTPHLDPPQAIMRLYKWQFIIMLCRKGVRRGLKRVRETELLWTEKPSFVNPFDLSSSPAIYAILKKQFDRENFKYML